MSSTATTASVASPGAKRRGWIDDHEPGKACKDGGDHEFPLKMTRQEAALLVEGNCPSCEIPASGRSEDGFAMCSCCGDSWVFGDGVVTLRIPYVVEESDDV